MTSTYELDNDSAEWVKYEALDNHSAAGVIYTRLNDHAVKTLIEYQNIQDIQPNLLGVFLKKSVIAKIDNYIASNYLEYTNVITNNSYASDNTPCLASMPQDVLLEIFKNLKLSDVIQSSISDTSNDIDLAGVSRALSYEEDQVP